MKIDAHQHFWKYNPVKHYWLGGDMTILKHDFLPEDLETILKNNGFDGTIAIHSEHNLEDTNFLLGLAGNHEFVKGVVGWVDLRASNLQEILEMYSLNSKFVGVRHLLAYDPDPEIMDNQEFINGVKALSKFNLTYDVVVKPNRLDDAANFIRKIPEVKFVLDHMGNPKIRNMHSQDWKKAIKTIASIDHVYCKISGLITESHWTEWEYVNLVPYLDHALECFGPNRLIFGSDWPTCRLAGTHSEVTGVAENFVKSLSASEKNAIMGQNAVDFYQLKM